MPIFSWALCSKQVIVDSKSNNLSLIEILEQFNVSDLPIVIPQIYYLASMWGKDSSFENKEETFRFKIVITSNPEKPPENEGIEAELKIPQDKKRVRHLVSIQGIPIQEEGTLYFIIYLKSEDTWKEVHRIPIDVKKI